MRELGTKKIDIDLLIFAFSNIKRIKVPANHLNELREIYSARVIKQYYHYMKSLDNLLHNIMDNYKKTHRNPEDFEK